MNVPVGLSFLWVVRWNDLYCWNSGKLDRESGPIPVPRGILGGDADLRETKKKPQPGVAGAAFVVNRVLVNLPGWTLRVSDRLRPADSAPGRNCAVRNRSLPLQDILSTPPV